MNATRCKQLSAESGLAHPLSRGKKVSGHTVSERIQDANSKNHTKKPSVHSDKFRDVESLARDSLRYWKGIQIMYRKIS